MISAQHPEEPWETKPGSAQHLEEPWPHRPHRPHNLKAQADKRGDISVGVETAAFRELLRAALNRLRLWRNCRPGPSLGRQVRGQRKQWHTNKQLGDKWGDKAAVAVVDKRPISHPVIEQ